MQLKPNSGPGLCPFPNIPRPAALSEIPVKLENSLDETLDETPMDDDEPLDSAIGDAELYLASWFADARASRDGSASDPDASPVSIREFSIAVVTLDRFIKVRAAQSAIQEKIHAQLEDEDYEAFQAQEADEHAAREARDKHSESDGDLAYD